MIVFILLLFLITGCGKFETIKTPPKEDEIVNLVEVNSANVQSYDLSGDCTDGESILIKMYEEEKMSTCNNNIFTMGLELTKFHEKKELLFEVQLQNKKIKYKAVNKFNCPANYIPVPKKENYSDLSFCVSKYEMKENLDNNLPESTPSGMPWVNITRDNAILKCQNLGIGFDLISNDQWQILARNIENVPQNWDSGVVGGGFGLNQGHSDSSPMMALEATSDDNDSCFLTEQNCNLQNWSNQRRIHFLSNGQIIWDLAGNVWEWVKDDNSSAYHLPRTGGFPNSPRATLLSELDYPFEAQLFNGTSSIFRNAKNQFGPEGFYPQFSDNTNHGGLGVTYLFQNAGTIHRGGRFTAGSNMVSGIFALSLGADFNNISDSRGFRCVFNP